jgi:hypothetical protein
MRIFIFIIFIFIILLFIFFIIFIMVVVMMVMMMMMMMMNFFFFFSFSLSFVFFFSLSFSFSFYFSFSISKFLISFAIIISIICSSLSSFKSVNWSSTDKTKNLLTKEGGNSSMLQVAIKWNPLFIGIFHIYGFSGNSKI